MMVGMIEVFLKMVEVVVSEEDNKAHHRLVGDVVAVGIGEVLRLHIIKMVHHSGDRKMTKGETYFLMMYIDFLT
jgi:hypothetical protein